MESEYRRTYSPLKLYVLSSNGRIEEYEGKVTESGVIISDNGDVFGIQEPYRENLNALKSSGSCFVRLSDGRYAALVENGKNDVDEESMKKELYEYSQLGMISRKKQRILIFAN